MGRWLVPALVVVAFAVVALALAGCGGGESAGSEQRLTLRLAEQNGSRQSGTATFTPAGEGTRVAMELSNPPDAPQPAHVHPGSCDDLGPPVVGLSNLVDGESETVVSMSLSDLQSGDLVVHAHKSEAEFETSVACAPIPKS